MSFVDTSIPIPSAPHFSWSELTRTEHRDYIEENEQVPLALQPAAVALAEMLEVVRAMYWSPLIVHSAYRCPALNRAIGGSPTSQHMSFQACDFHVVGQSLYDVFKAIRSRSEIHFGQLLLEGADPTRGKASWIHLSLGAPWRDPTRCGEVLFFSTITGKYSRP